MSDIAVQRLIILHDVTKEQWKRATEKRKAELIAEGEIYYSTIKVITSKDLVSDENILS